MKTNQLEGYNMLEKHQYSKPELQYGSKHHVIQNQQFWRMQVKIKHVHVSSKPLIMN